MMHGTHSLASALEQAQKVSLRNAFSGLGVCVYRVLQISSLHCKSERRGRIE
jgi:hypothetical protein